MTDEQKIRALAILCISATFKGNLGELSTQLKNLENVAQAFTSFIKDGEVIPSTED